jgi:hypothetical protein
VESDVVFTQKHSVPNRASSVSLSGIASGKVGLKPTWESISSDGIARGAGPVLCFCAYASPCSPDFLVSRFQR